MKTHRYWLENLQFIHGIYYYATNQQRKRSSPSTCNAKTRGWTNNLKNAMKTGLSGFFFNHHITFIENKQYLRRVLKILGTIHSKNKLKTINFFKNPFWDLFCERRKSQLKFIFQTAS